MKPTYQYIYLLQENEVKFKTFRKEKYVLSAFTAIIGTDFQAGIYGPGGRSRRPRKAMIEPVI